MTTVGAGSRIERSVDGRSGCRRARSPRPIARPGRASRSKAPKTATGIGSSADRRRAPVRRRARPLPWPRRQARPHGGGRRPVARTTSPSTLRVARPFSTGSGDELGRGSTPSAPSPKLRRSERVQRSGESPPATPGARQRPPPTGRWRQVVQRALRVRCRADAMNSFAPRTGACCDATALPREPQQEYRDQSERELAHGRRNLAARAPARIRAQCDAASIAAQRRSHASTSAGRGAASKDQRPIGDRPPHPDRLVDADRRERSRAGRTGRPAARRSSSRRQRSRIPRWA